MSYTATEFKGLSQCPPPGSWERLQVARAGGHRGRRLQLDQQRARPSGAGCRGSRHRTPRRDKQGPRLSETKPSRTECVSGVGGGRTRHLRAGQNVGFSHAQDRGGVGKSGHAPSHCPATARACAPKGWGRQTEHCPLRQAPQVKPLKGLRRGVRSDCLKGTGVLSDENVLEPDSCPTT